MNPLDCIELWVESLRHVFSSFNISVFVNRTEDDRPNHSCSVTLRRDDVEIDFIVWESGHGELAVTREQGEFSEEHLEDLSNKEALATVLARILGDIFESS